jgi:hypothetical protein
VTVRFTDAWTDDTGAVSVTDTARVQSMGEVIATTLDYPGIRYQGLAMRVAERDLRALSAPLLTGEIVVNREGANLGPGDVIRLRSERLGLRMSSCASRRSARATGATMASASSSLEDVFALGATAIAGGRMPTRVGQSPSRHAPSPGAWWQKPPTGFSSASWAMPRRIAFWRTTPMPGRWSPAGERPSADALAAQLWIDPGTGPAQEGVGGLRPYSACWRRT